MAHVLVPVKDQVLAKTRLSEVLAPDERRALNQAMLEDVLGTVSAHPEVEKIVLVSNDPAARLLAEIYAAELFNEHEAGARNLNEALTAARNHVAEAGATDVLILHSDLPLISASDLDALFEQGARSDVDVVIGPDAGNSGTNALLTSAKSPLALQFGVDSFSRHTAGAERLGLKIAVVQSKGIECDIDSADDLQELFGEKDTPDCGRRTAEFLSRPNRLVAKCRVGGTLTDAEALSLADVCDLDLLTDAGARLRDAGFANVVTYSPKVFIPLTKLCRDVCHYCTFAQTPRHIPQPYMSVDEVLESCRQAEKLGCKEALFTLGEKPELRYRVAREALADLGFTTTLEYVAHVAGRVLEETSLLPHINAGCMTEEEISLLRPVSASMGIMLESASERLCEKGMPHYGSPDKQPAVRLETIELAGRAQVPFTSGILIGIGETRRERIESLLRLRELHERHDHLQEIIVQNFRAKPQTKMAGAEEPDLEELVWTVAVARLIFGPEMSIQAPPNLSPGGLRELIDAGINDWGGISPLTPDFVNPEAPWPHLEALAEETAKSGKHLKERLTIYPRYALESNRWLDESLRTRVMRSIDASGFPRTDNWTAGESGELPSAVTQQIAALPRLNRVSADVRDIVSRGVQGAALAEAEITRLFSADGEDLSFVCDAANELRASVNGDTVTYAVNRNINYTNICYFKCQFCAFSKGSVSQSHRGKSYDLDSAEIARRSVEAWERGATEVCMQGGIHPHYTGETYLDIVRTVKNAVPDMHVHAFSPLEIAQGAETLGISVREFLAELKHAGLGSLPGTAAEILDDEVRAVICPDKLNSQQWCDVIETAHDVGLKTTATIMFGHVDQPKHWARHLIKVRDIQRRTGGITEFVPLPFVASEAPIYSKGNARKGPSFREAILMHAVSRIALHGQIDNIQASWVKLGTDGVEVCLGAGANDVGGTLMNESITRAAGAEHGQEWAPEEIEATIVGLDRVPLQRTTLYERVPRERSNSAKGAKALESVVNTLPARRGQPQKQRIGAAN